MVHLEKSQPAPECLIREKEKATGDHRCGDVLQRLAHDFKDKCYLCEYKKPTSIHVDHFIPHKGDRDLRFDWNNLFLACPHCNQTKGAGYEGILNCTNKNDRVDADIEYLINPFPSFRIEIRLVIENARTRATQALLLAVYGGNTKTQRLESAYLRDALREEMERFQELLGRYHGAIDAEKRNDLMGRIKEHLDSALSFTAFKRWIIRGDERLKEEFEGFFQ
uniref:TIGR02646 family protein n=1 Tax=Candidatus Kentrum sp. UNK TaxID=2126344 RepID=A0A451ARJ8_9GAMM|nr:MAG: TIGR02646 family protein [Candidatus Kentron sp. UNK]VFK73143.1 MAG: TIGR02646 family protein [Candidatus Kentron sp. UNK]